MAAEFAMCLFLLGNKKLPHLLNISSRKSKKAFKLDATQREAKVANLREWSLTSLDGNRPTALQQFSLSEVKQPFAKFAIFSAFRKLLMTSKFGCFASLCVALRPV